MAEAINLERAQAVYNSLCRKLDEINWRYTRHDENLSIDCDARGDDLPMSLVFRVNAEKSMLLLISRLPFTVPEDKRLDMAIASTVANYRLADGCFDYDIKSGNMYFRMTNSFVDSMPGGEVFTYMLFCSCGTIDEYNDKFLMLTKGYVSIEKFIEQESQ